MIYFNLKKKCGIVSIHSGKPLDQLKDKFKMLSKVGHRGPDGEGIVYRKSGNAWS